MKTSKCALIKEVIISDIKQRKLLPGAQVSSENELASFFKVNRSTVQRALHSLTQSGLLTRTPGVGTFVSDTPFGKSQNATKNKRSIIFIYNNDGDFEETYHFQVFLGAEKEARRRGCNLLFRSFANGSEIKSFLKTSKSANKIDGFIFSMTPKYDFLEPGNIPKVCYGGNPFFKNRFDVVTPDNHYGAYEIVKYLLDLGHRRIACLSMPGDFRFKERVEGYLRALMENNINIDNELLWEWVPKTNLVDRIKKNKVTAVFGCNDCVISEILVDCLNAGLRVPEDISLAGFDNRNCLTVPKISTVGFSSEDMGNTAMRIILDRIENPRMPFTKIIIPTKLIIRESCAPLKKK